MVIMEGWSLNATPLAPYISLLVKLPMLLIQLKFEGEISAAFEEAQKDIVSRSSATDGLLL